MRQKRQQAADRDLAFAHLGGEIALAAERLEHVIIGRRRHLVVRFENRMRDLVDLRPDALQDVGGPVDHRVEQIHQHRLARHFGRARARQFLLDNGERTRLVVAHGGEAMAGEDKGDRGGLGRGVRLAHQRRRHVAGAVLDIEPAGDLDLLHFFARRHRDAEKLLDQIVFLHGRRDQIDPHGRRRRGCRPVRSQFAQAMCRAERRPRASSHTDLHDRPRKSEPATGSCAPHLSWPDPAATRKT